MSTCSPCFRTLPSQASSVPPRTAAGMARVPLGRSGRSGEVWGGNFGPAEAMGIAGQRNRVPGFSTMVSVGSDPRVQSSYPPRWKKVCQSRRYECSERLAQSFRGGPASSDTRARATERGPVERSGRGLQPERGFCSSFRRRFKGQDHTIIRSASGEPGALLTKRPRLETVP